MDERGPAGERAFAFGLMERMRGMLPEGWGLAVVLVAPKGGTGFLQTYGQVFGLTLKEALGVYRGSAAQMAENLKAWEEERKADAEGH